MFFGEAEMNWTNERPHIAGYYWVIERDKEPSIVEVLDEEGKRSVLKIGDNRKYPIEVWYKAIWCGPLSPC